MRITTGSGEFFRIEQLPASLRQWIQYDVPVEYRYYDKEEDKGYWYIHRKHLLGVIELAYKCSGQVDYSALDDYIQIEVATAKEGWIVNKKRANSGMGAQTNIPHSMVLLDAYSTLHLLPSASSSLVSVVWRSLAKETHPDRGGDPELFRKYSKAFNTIKEEEKK